MHMPMWSDLLRTGDDAIDSCHREILSGLNAIHGAVRAQDFGRAERIIEDLSDACSIHAQSEDEAFVGCDHGFPHESIDDLMLTLSRSIHHRLDPERILDTVHALGQTLLSDIGADRSELARLAKNSSWHLASRKWLNAAD